MQLLKAREIAKHYTDLFVTEFGNKGKVYLSGGLRRQKFEVHDIDLVVCAESQYHQEIMAWWKSQGEKQSGGNRVVFFLHECRNESIKVEVRYTEPQFLGAMLLHATGNAEFNRAMRTVAIRRNLKLSQYGLADRETGVTVCEGLKEEDLFDTLGITYAEPILRGDPFVINSVWKAI